MARRAAAEIAVPAPKSGSIMHQLLMSAIALGGLLILGIGYYKVENFLVKDSRLVLPGPPEPGLTSAYFRIEGAVHTSDQQIIQVFATDFGRTIYRCPIAERRLQLMGIDWIKDATVTRVWPNRLVVKVTERTPVAFAPVPVAGGMVKIGLIDDDGVLLGTSRAGKMNLPVLTGVSSADDHDVRRQRVQRFLRVQKELGSHMDKVSEVDVSDIENVKVTEQFNNRTIVLMLGNQKFAERIQNFVNTADQIRQRMPDATMLDLRLPDRITAVGGNPRVD